MNNISEIYKKWINNQNFKDIQTISEPNKICFKHGLIEGCVEFYSLKKEIVELKIVNLTNNENKFFLHFELNNIERAKELFTEMIECLLDLKNNNKTKVLICCTSGITSSYFCEKLNEYSKKENITFEFYASNYSEIYSKGIDFEYILLTPQIKHQSDEIKNIFKDKIVEDIPVKTFATYDVFKIFELLSKTKNSNVTYSPKRVNKPLKLGTYLVICIIHYYQNFKIVYSIYNQCEKINQGEILKNKYSLKDIEDFLDYASFSFPNIEKIYICTPGMISNNLLSFPFFNIYDQDLVENFSKKYNKQFYLCNDANALARGYFEEYKNIDNFILYYSPLASRVGGAGIIIDNKLYNGNNGLAGEVQFYQKLLTFSDDVNTLSKTIEGQIELCYKQLLILISCFSPDKIALCCPMITDLSKVKQNLQKYIPNRFIPQIIKVDEDIETMVYGAILLANET